MVTLEAREVRFCLLRPVEAHSQKRTTLRGYNLNSQEEPYGAEETLDSLRNSSPP